MTLSPLRIGLLGCGVVGGGVLTLLHRNAELINRRAGRPLQITRMATRTPAKVDRALLSPQVAISQDLQGVCHAPDVDVVVEVMGGLEPARELVLAAVRAGKSVVTANKALLAVHGNEIAAAARAAGVQLYFEAAVAGGIPILKALQEGLAANRIQWIAGIINGTTNYILSTMRQGVPYADALHRAQQLGYAEMDTTLDINGTDAAHKLMIMASLAFDMPLCLERVQVIGIQDLDVRDMAYAEELGYRVKLLGVVRQHPQGVELWVEPALVPVQRLIADVDGALNAVLVCGDGTGPTLYYGKGAGAEPTGSAVIADLMDAARRAPGLTFSGRANIAVLPAGESAHETYLRLRVFDKPGVLAEVARILADQHISIEAMTQHAPEMGENQVDMVMLMANAPKKHIRAALARIAQLPAVCGRVVSLRVEALSESSGS